MALLGDHRWKAKYTPDDGDLLRQFYLQALEAAQRYDRTTGYFSATALAVAARGIEGLVRNAGRMRLLVGCTLEAGEVEAITRGEDLRGTAAAALLRMPLAPPDADAQAALELLAWMVAKGYLEVKVALPCGEDRRPIAGLGLFHEKSGVIEDKTGDRLAFSGSVNETAAGWKLNWESFHVFLSWSGGEAHVAEEEKSFATLWEDRSPRAVVFDVPEAVKQALLRFLPEGEPERLRSAPPDSEPPSDAQPPAWTLKPEPQALPLPFPDSAPSADARREARRRRVWAFIREAPARPEGVCIGEATSAVEPWPHQIRAFHRLYDAWPPRLLIADEVGLGKTIEAGLLIRQAWLSGRARRILILAPKAVLSQWQVELREKFNLNWPIYDGQSLVWRRTPGWTAPVERRVAGHAWHAEPFVLMSSQLARRQERQPELLAAEPWDLVILDEAHHARRSSPGQPGEGGPNLLLRLMQALRPRTRGLVLLTATPMQVHPVEVWDLLALLGLPPEWHADAFLDYFKLVGRGAPTAAEFEKLAMLFRAGEAAFGSISDAEAAGLVQGRSALRARRILRALRDRAATPRQQLSAEEKRDALALLRSRSPVASLISRHTRDLLREYHRRGRLGTPIADRVVSDAFLPLSEAERTVYEAMEDYIATTYNRAAAEERNAVGFVMTIYRRRLASSFRALACTLQDRFEALEDARRALRPGRPDEDAPDDDTAPEPMDADDVLKLENRALRSEERGEIRRLLEQVKALPADSKALRLVKELESLEAAGYAQAIVFTQYTDTLDFLREHLVRSGRTVLCFSGRGGERLDRSGDWRPISREETRRRFRDGEAQVLLCTDAAAEGLNFQFCGALLNYDSPWNPMRVEQRIGRVDRLGQRFAQIRIVNLMYENTVEADVYHALRTRIGLFTAVVGRLQPILASLPARIASAALAGGGDNARRVLVSGLEQSLREAEGGFDIDAATEAALEVPSRPAAPYDRAELGRLLRHPDLLPAGLRATALSEREAALALNGAPAVRATTDRDFFEEHSESVDLWTPGSPLFPPLDEEVDPKDRESVAAVRHLGELLD